MNLSSRPFRKPGLGPGTFSKLAASKRVPNILSVRPVSFPIEIPSDFGALEAASLTGEQGLEIGKADVIRPSVALISTLWLHL
jgi:hypothetical protein